MLDALDDKMMASEPSVHVRKYERTFTVVRDFWPILVYSTAPLASSYNRYPGCREEMRFEIIRSTTDLATR